VENPVGGETIEKPQHEKKKVEKKVQKKGEKGDSAAVRNFLGLVRGKGGSP